MKNFLTFVLFLSLLPAVYGQPEINCDTIYSAPSQSEYVLPYPPGHTYTVTQSNCHPTGGHFLTFAYDFNTNMGDTIVACRSGIVTFVNDQYSDTDWVSGHENNVFIGHSDGTRIRYTHLMQGGVLVNVNDQVEQGQPIGLSGNSGNTGGFPHLHLSAFRDNTSFNRQNTIPLNFCNTDDPVNDQNLLIQGQSYLAFDKNTTSISNSEFDQIVSVYPNPAKTTLFIELSQSIPFTSGKFSLHDLLGKKLLARKMGTSKTEFDLSQIPNGIYFLALNMDEGKRGTIRILVQR